MRKLKIAVIGSGISGLSASWELSKYHDIHLFEKNNYYGGHANTLKVVNLNIFLFLKQTKYFFGATLVCTNMFFFNTSQLFLAQPSNSGFSYSSLEVIVLGINENLWILFLHSPPYLTTRVPRALKKLY